MRLSHHRRSKHLASLRKRKPAQVAHAAQPVPKAERRSPPIAIAGMGMGGGLALAAAAAGLMMRRIETSGDDDART